MDFFGRDDNAHITLNARLPLENGSHSPQTLAKRVSDDSQHFIFRLPKNSLSRFCDEIQQFLHVFRPILKSYTFLSVSGICSMKNYTMWTKYHPCTMQKVVFHALSKSGIFFVSFFLATGGTVYVNVQCESQVYKSGEYRMQKGTETQTQTQTPT